MVEDIAKQPDPSLSSRHMAKPEYSTHVPVSESESRFTRFMRKVNRFFNFTQILAKLLKIYLISKQDCKMSLTLKSFH